MCSRCPVLVRILGLLWTRVRPFTIGQVHASSQRLGPCPRTAPVGFSVLSKGSPESTAETACL